MQQLKTAAALFCTACICAELVGQLLGDARGRQCIKAAAGLYIVTALFHALPGIGAGALDLALPQVQAERFGSASEAILLQAGQDLAEDLEARLAAETGLAVELRVTLAQSEAGVYAAGVEAALPAGAGEAERAAAGRVLGAALGIEPEAIAWAQGEGG